MSSSLKISADTSEVKKSILDIGKSFKDLKGTKVSIFNEDDKKFIRTQFVKEIGLMKNKLKENRAEISKMVDEQSKMVDGSQQELSLRMKILDAYKTQAKLGNQLGKAQSAVKRGGSLDSAGQGGISGMVGGLMNFMKMIPGMAAAATIGYGVTKGYEANSQYVKGTPSRNRLKGLGVNEDSFGSAEDLGRVGLSEQDMIQRRIEATSVLGRQGTNNETEMRKAGFERAYGLEGGTMTGIAGQLRGTMGGQGATDAQMKLQASVQAAGIEDAIGPYLQSAVQLLSSINENGATNTGEMTSMLAQLTKDGGRTPEMMSKTFGGINDAVKGATGEKSAFLQTAFARGGIGGGSIGGTKYAMESGGIFGLDRDALEKRGYNKDLLGDMDKNGMFSGLGKRTGALMDMFKSQGGLNAGDSISGIKNTSQMVGMGNLANNVFGTKGDQGYDALLMLEKVQNKQMTQKQFDDKLKQMKESTPETERLDKINNTLSGQTELLRIIAENKMESLGKQAVVTSNALTKVDNQGIEGLTNTAGAINDTGIIQGAGDKAEGIGKYINGGNIGSKLYDNTMGIYDQYKSSSMTSPDAIIDFAKKRRDAGTGFKGMSDQQIETKVKDSLKGQSIAKDIGKEVANALRNAPINNLNKITLPDGKVTEQTSK